MKLGVLKAMADAGRDERRQDRFDGDRSVARVRLEGGQEIAPFLGQRIDAASDDSADEALLRAEVVVDRGRVSLGGCGDLADRRPREATLDEEPLRDVQEPLRDVCRHLPLPMLRSRRAAWCAAPGLSRRSARREDHQPPVG
jgi:hypothetical protein